LLSLDLDLNYRILGLSIKHYAYWRHQSCHAIFCDQSRWRVVAAVLSLSQNHRDCASDTAKPIFRTSGKLKQDEAVDQRVLIDNVLARYSGNFTGQSRFPRVPMSISFENSIDQYSVSRASTELG
jgi:hypothetical protein